MIEWSFGGITSIVKGNIKFVRRLLQEASENFNQDEIVNKIDSSFPTGA